jgi:hypothetical protein
MAIIVESIGDHPQLALAIIVESIGDHPQSALAFIYIGQGSRTLSRVGLQRS